MTRSGHRGHEKTRRTLDYGRSQQIWHSAERHAAICGCGIHHTEESWQALELNGIQNCGDGGPKIEMRTCGCGSTLGREVES